MKNATALATALSALLLAAGCGGSSTPKSEGEAADSQSLSAKMTPRQVVTPQGKPFAVPASLNGASGAFSGTLTGDDELRWRISSAKLGSPRLVVADIHVGSLGEFGPVLVRLCGPCKPVQNGVLKLKPTIARKLRVGNQWVTLITEKYPNGVVRGQISVK